MRKLSRLNLLDEVLTEREEPKKGFFATFFERALESKRRALMLTIPKYYYIRGEMYAKYIDNELLDMNVELDYEFGIKQLIYLIYEDYFKLIQKGTNLHSFAKHLMNRRELVMHGSMREKDFQQAHSLGQYVTYKSIERQKISPALSPYLTDSVIDVHIHMEKDDIIHGEIIVNDIRRQYDDFDLTLEDMVQIRYIDIMDSVITGTSEEVTKEILRLMKNYEYDKFKHC